MTKTLNENSYTDTDSVSTKKLQLSSMYGEVTPPKKFLIIQWGTERSLVQYIDGYDNEILIMDNQYLMNLDEMGKVITS